MEIKYYIAINKNNKEQEYAEFDNVIFSKNGLYYRALKNNKYKKGIALHNAIYIYYNNLNISEIPKGYCIHHIDENKNNNDISNLIMLTNSEHAKLHANKMSNEQKQKISNTLKGNKLSNETKLKISNTLKNKNIIK